MRGFDTVAEAQMASDLKAAERDQIAVSGWDEMAMKMREEVRFEINLRHLLGAPLANGMATGSGRLYGRKRKVKAPRIYRFNGKSYPRQSKREIARRAAQLAKRAS